MLGATAAARGARAGALIAILCLGLGLIGACQAQAPTPRASAAPSLAPTGAPSVSAGPQPASPSFASVEVDASLLRILPDEIAGAPMQPAPEAALEIAVNPSLAADVEAVAVALAVSAGSSGSEDLVIANVVRLRPDVFNETFFRGWRDSYDGAACEPAGGVTGNAEAEIDGRRVYIGSCVNGPLTYHVRYGEDVIVSITSIGDGRFGEQLVAKLGD